VVISIQSSLNRKLSENGPGTLGTGPGGTLETGPGGSLGTGPGGTSGTYFSFLI